jgi:hypothetical protein
MSQSNPGSPPALLSTAEGAIWSFDLERYDRIPLFRDGEWEALDTLVTRPGRFTGVWPPTIRAALERLLAPLRDVLPREQFKNVYTRVLTEMHRRRKPYWAWSDAEWLETIHTTSRRNFPRADIVACAYRLCGFRPYDDVERLSVRETVRYVFGADIVAAETQKATEAAKNVGYSHQTQLLIAHCLWHVMLIQCSPRLQDITVTTLVQAQRNIKLSKSCRSNIFGLGQALRSLGILKEPLGTRAIPVTPLSEQAPGVAPEWARWCATWRDLSTIDDQGKQNSYRSLLRIGLWLAEVHPTITSPAQWDRKLCAQWVAAVNNAKIGDWVFRSILPNEDRRGEALSPRTKDRLLASTRVFFLDLQNWEMIPLRFNPVQALETPRDVLALIRPDPRDLDDATWLKLVWASLNLTEADLVTNGRSIGAYPFALIRALAVLWTHAAMRASELARFPIGGTRPQEEDLLHPQTGAILFPAGTLCYVQVPASKSSGSYWKPVSSVVRRFVLEWEAERPVQPKLLDGKTKRKVDFLFMIRGRRVGMEFINQSLIPLLAHKAGVPLEDARGTITSHRGRASAATMLGNGEEGMSLLELMHWLGHKSPLSTLSYLRVRDATMSRAFAAADQSARMIQVLIDQEAVRNGEAAAGKPWRYYDLGNSYCTYEFWSRCKHRMVCPGCAWNVPKSSARGQALEAKQFLMRVLEEVPLTDDERGMVEGGIGVHDAILAKLATEPTPDGRTPDEIGSSPSPTKLIQLSYSREPLDSAGNEASISVDST